MNRAWLIRAEERITRLERKLAELGAVVEVLKTPPPEPEKRGPGRPKKEAPGEE